MWNSAISTRIYLFPPRCTWKKNSKPLESAAKEANNYLDEKRAYSHPAEGKTQLQSQLDIQLQSYRSLPTSYNMERLETYTRKVSRDGE